MKKKDPQLDHAPELLTVDEAAVFLRITRGAAYAMIERGTMPGVVRIGRRAVRVRRDDLRQAYGLVASAPPTIPPPTR